MSFVQFRRGLAIYVRSECGAAASEYALLLIILAGCSAVLLRHLGGNINGVFAKVARALGPHP